MLTLAFAAWFLGQTPGPNPDRIHAVSFGQGGRLLAACQGLPDQEGTVIVWERALMNPVWQKRVRNVKSVQFTPDGKRLAIAADSVELWDVETWKRIASYPHPRPVLGLAFDSNQRMATSAADNVIRVWDRELEKIIWQSEPVTLPMPLLALSPDGKLLVGCDRQKNCLHWDLGSNAVTSLNNGLDGPASGAGYSRDGSALFLTNSSNGVTRLLDTKSKTLRHRTNNSNGSFVTAFHPGTNTMVSVVDSTEGREKLHMRSFRLTPATADEEARIQELVRILDDNDIGIRDQAEKSFARFGLEAEPILEKVYRETKSAEVRLRTRKILIRLRDHGLRSIPLSLGRVTSLALSPDGRYAALGGMSGTLHVIELENEKTLHSLKLKAGQSK